MLHDPRPASLWRREHQRDAPDSGWAGADEPDLFPEAHSGGGAGEAAPRQHAATDPDYRRWRAERLREFDADYEDWRRERYRQFCAEFDGWRRDVQRSREASETRRLGARDDGAPSEDTDTFFERS